MQAVLDSHALKGIIVTDSPLQTLMQPVFAKALLCLSKYGDDLTLHASTDVLALSATNSSKSAYCRFRLAKNFFSRYHLDIPLCSDPDGPNVPDDVIGQVLTKSLLSILKHNAIDKSVERCELHIYDGVRSGEGTETNDIESKLIVRMHCKHGVVKTHRLLLMTHNALLAPSTLDGVEGSHVIIGSKMLKEMLDHFPTAKGKSDPRLVWSFGEAEVGVKSLDTSIENKGKVQLSTELAMNANEFDDYSIRTPPITIAFHLREFSATISYADSMNLSLVLRFTDPATPLYIEIDGENDSTETLFVISTSQVHGAPSRPPNPGNNTTVTKRDRDDRTTPVPSKKFIRAVQPVETSLNASANRVQMPSRMTTSPALSPVLQARNHSQTGTYRNTEVPGDHEPLFLLSPPPQPQAVIGSLRRSSPLNDLLQNGWQDDEMELEATQKTQERLNFHPLFED
ncbi:hypothetical protein AX15_004236 [Amanita polypyramis BW_CC]|nr:hypothetical protein AX15_004236 [Amanita polypyramis BW_CC]